MKRIKLELTEDQATEVIYWLNHAAEIAFWLDVDDPDLRKKGRDIAAFRRRISNAVRRELVKANS